MKTFAPRYRVYSSLLVLLVIEFQITSVEGKQPDRVERDEAFDHKSCAGGECIMNISSRVSVCHARTVVDVSNSTEVEATTKCSSSSSFSLLV